MNGITSAQMVGEFEGYGGEDVLEIPPSAFRYGEDNILLVELSADSSQQNVLFGSSWPESGQITGSVLLEAVVETTVATPQVSVSWSGTNAEVTVKTSLLHHSFSQEGPWTVDGVLSDGSAEIAERSLTVQAQENGNSQQVTMTFPVPNAKQWSVQDPFLYQLHLTVTNSLGDRDDVAYYIGLRSIVLASGKWVINGKVLAINGEALTPQQDYDLRQKGQIEAWLKTERQKGINLIYFIGQIPDDLWLHAADQVGMGIWAELPVEMTPSGRLPNADIYQDLINEKMIHPSLLAWTVGKGLDSDALAQNYLRKAASEVQPIDLAFALTITPTSNSGLPADQTIYIQGNKIQGSWGQVVVQNPPPTTSLLWGKEPMVAYFWAILMIFLALMNIRSIPWRYKEIGEKKPKRRLRKAWFWLGWFILAREAMLGGIITSIIFSIPIDSNFWFSHLWPGIHLLQTQSPWLIWGFLSILLMLIRLLQTGVAAPHLPQEPHVVGLMFWLERRYYFAVLIALGWALIPWGLPFYIPLLGYLFLSLLFLPLRIHDIHRIGGKYRSFLWVPGILTGTLLVWGVFHYADWIYLWHMGRSFISISNLKRFV
jgi:hypothetical protein